MDNVSTTPASFASPRPGLNTGDNVSTITPSQAESLATKEALEYFKIQAATYKQELKESRDRYVRLQLQMRKEKAEHEEAMALHNTPQEPVAPHLKSAEQTTDSEKDQLIGELRSKLAEMKRQRKLVQSLLQVKNELLDERMQLIWKKDDDIECLEHRLRNQGHDSDDKSVSENSSHGQPHTPADPIVDSEE